MTEENKVKCKTCEYFLPDILVIDKYGYTIRSFGCELGGSYPDAETFYKGCKDFKIIKR